MYENRSDEEIIQRVLAGEKKCYSILVQRYQQAAYKLSLGILRQPADAEDAVSEALVKTFSSLSGERQITNFKSWLLKITYNCCQDILRHRQKQKRIVSLDDYKNIFSKDSPLKDVIIEEQKQQLWQSLGKLEVEERSAIIMKYYSGASYQEISDTLGWPMGTVASRLYRAREKLRQFINGGEPYES